MDPFKDLYQSSFIEGYCKQENTTQYFKRFFNDEATSAYTELDGIKISRIGFGSYRVARGNAIFEKALELAILNGVNLIDTSSNYGDGSSESLIGDVIRKLIDESRIKREEIFLVTKIGYIQGKNLQLVEEMEKQGKAFPDITYYDPNCFHCISPDFLEDQLTRARKRLGFSVIDAVLLHNPEYFLMDSEHHNVSREKAISEYYDRIKKAFAFLELKRQEGIIRYYGISSNTFPKEESAYTFTSLSKVLEISQNMYGLGSGFKLIQFPANLYETGFITEKNNSGESIATLAQKKNLFTLINRPLNAMKKQGGMDRLAIYQGNDLNLIKGKLENFTNQLKEFQQSMFQTLGIENVNFTFVSVIETYRDKFNSKEHYHQALNYSVIPQIKDLLSRIEKLDKANSYYTFYLDLLNEGIEKLEQYVEARISEKMQPLLSKLQKLDNVFLNKTLSQASVIALLPFTNSVLVGMRREEYVKDILPILKSELPKLTKKDFNNFEI